MSQKSNHRECKERNWITEETIGSFVVRERMGVWITGAIVIFLGIILFFLELFFHIQSIPIWIYLVILMIIMSGVLVYMKGKNRKLIVTGDKMCYVNLLGKSRGFKLQEIGCVKAAANSSAGQDYIRIFDQTGGKLCKLECSMYYAMYLLSFLHDNGIKIETPEDSGNLLTELVMQEQIGRELIPERAEKAYADTRFLIKEWQEKNRKMGAGFCYGLAQYHAEKIEPELEIQTEKSRCCFKQGENLPEDYLCVVEIYVTKDGEFIRDRRNHLLAMAFPVIDRRQPDMAGAKEVIWFHKDYKRKIAEALEQLEHELPRHKFKQEKIQLFYELKKTLL